MKRRRWKKGLAGLLAVIMALALMPLTSMAYINRGVVDITGQDIYELASGSKAYITIRPFREEHLPGCQMDICPTECGPGCIIYIDGQMECTCGGLEMETYYAEVEAESSDPTIAEAVYNDRGTVVITAKSKGVATVHIVGAFREYTTSEKTIKILVDGAEDPDHPSDPGNDPGGSGNENPSDPGNDPGGSGNENPNDPGNDPGGSGNDNPNDPGNDPGGSGSDNPGDPGNDPGGSGSDNPGKDDPVGPYSGLTFTDVDGWAKVYVYYLAELGVINGKAEGIFAPQDNVTRAEFAKILAAASGNKIQPVSEAPFDDVPVLAWYAPYVAWAKTHGIVNGVGDNRFNPQSEISRQDIAVMICRYAEKQGLDFPEKEQAKFFTDAADISGYAAEAVQRMQKAGIISGYPDGSFGPKKYATRAETAKMVAVFLQSTHIC